MAETVGSIIDKINVIQLKIYHNREQLAETSVKKELKPQIERKINILNELLSDLSLELNQLIDDIKNGRKKLKVYRQFKMYGKIDLGKKG